MKRNATILLVAVMILSAVLVLCACTPKTDSAVDVAIKEAAGMSWDELLQKAKAEIGDNELSIYGTTSRVDEESFTKATGIKIKVSQPNDSQIYEMLEHEVGGNVYGADVILTTDSFNLINFAMAEGWVKNYVPDAYKDNIAESDRDPLVCLYYNRSFVYNNGDGKGADKLTNYITNVWQLTEPEYKCEVKSPLLEKCTMNFLITLTSPAWQSKLAAAYKSYYKKDWQEHDEFYNVSLEWICKFIENCSFVNKDGTIASDVKGGQPGSLGFFTLSKFRSVKGSDLTICAHENVEGFSGMLYPIYIMLTSNAKYPYAACLYVNYLMGQEGFQTVFGKEAGAYSGNKSISVTDDAKADGDEPLSFWLDRLVVEDGPYISGVYVKYATQIMQWCANK